MHLERSSRYSTLADNVGIDEGIVRFHEFGHLFLNMVGSGDQRLDINPEFGDHCFKVDLQVLPEGIEELLQGVLRGGLRGCGIIVQFRRICHRGRVRRPRRKGGTIHQRWRCILKEFSEPGGLRFRLLACKIRHHGPPPLYFCLTLRSLQVRGKGAR